MLQGKPLAEVRAREQALDAARARVEHALGRIQRLRRRKAQVYVRSQEKWKQPYYWAAWVLWGLLWPETFACSQK